MTRTRITKGLLFVVLLTVILGVGYYFRDHINPEHLQNTLKQWGMWAPLFFITLYFIGTVALLPGALLTISGGVIFGPLLGVIYNMIGASIGAALSFLIARYFASDWAKQKTGPKMQTIMNGIATEGWRFVALTRLTPIVPFNLLNYALGVTDIPFRQYFLTTVVCIFPGCLAYTYLGYLGTEAAQAKEGLVQKALFALFLLALAAYSKRIFGWIKSQRNN